MADFFAEPKRRHMGGHQMRNPFGRIATGCVLALAGIASAAYAQAPAAPKGSVVVASPTYTSIAMEITVNRPAAEVWKRVGKYCDVSEWLQVPAGCKIISGKDGEFGAVRSVGNGEVLVGRTELSYTYAQTPKEGTPFNLYHGTVEARPVTPTTSKLVYTLFFDNSMLSDNAARAADKETRRARFTQALQNMKTLAEGGKLPPVPPPAR
jgi:Polyketide cyclase / dehydrase and lipid transport